MVDTVNLGVRRVLCHSVGRDLQAAQPAQFLNWYFEGTVRRCQQTGDQYRSIFGHNKLLGITVKGKGDVIESIQASLPRILHGYNGRLIKDPFELKRALEKLYGLLDEISTPIEPEVEFTRVDLVLNLPGDSKRFVLAHRNARHPKVRRESIVYDESGIRFPGEECVIQLYWKQKERADKAGFDLPALSKSIRVEIQLRKGQVRKILGGGDAAAPVSSLDFFHCYRCYRYILCQFDKEAPVQAPVEKCSLLALIAECEAVGFKTSSGMSAMDWYSLSGQKQATLNRNRVEIQKRQREIMVFKWAELLPPLRLPEPVIDILRNGLEVPLTNLW